MIPKKIWLPLLICFCLFFTHCVPLVPPPQITDQGIFQLEELLLEEPKNPDMRFDLANAYFREFQLSQHPDFLDNVILQTKEALKQRLNFGRASGLLGLALIFKGIIIKQEELVNDGLEFYAAAFDIDPQLSEDVNYPPYEYIKANIPLWEGKSSKEVRENIYTNLKNAIRAKPLFAPSHGLLAELFLQDKNHELALHEYQEAARINPEDPSYHMGIGLIYLYFFESRKDRFFQDHLDAAIKEIKEVIRLEPGNIQAHTKLGRLFGHKGLPDLQLYEAKEALRLVNEQAKTIPPNLRRGEKDLYGATPLRIVAIGTHESIGNYYASQGKYHKAIMEYKKALHIEPRYVWAHVGMGFTYLLRGKYDKASQQLKKYLYSNHPNHLYINLWYYHCLLGENQDGRAKRFLQRLHFFNPENNWQQALLDYHLDKITRKELLKQAISTRDRTEAYYYIGMEDYFRDNREQARSNFNKATNENNYLLYEYTAAKAFMNRL